MKNIGRHLLFIFLFFLVCFFILRFWLKAYTNHGQSLELSSYIGTMLDVAVSDAEDRSFEIVVLDSVFIVGKPSGEILRQNPSAGAKVKEDRKIYVTVSKGQADQIPVRRLPMLYGKSYERKSRELLQAFEINTKIVDRQFDRGAPDHILKVLYEGEVIIDGQSRRDHVLIDKGGMLEIVVSKSSGGQLTMPDMVCKTYDEAVFQLQTLNLVLGSIEESADVGDRNAAYVWRQYPTSSGSVNMGDTITLYLQADLPENCDF